MEKAILQTRIAYNSIWIPQIHSLNPHSAFIIILLERKVFKRFICNIAIF